jgi:hypothetical protein
MANSFLTVKPIYVKDPASCMFFEPLCCLPVNRVNPFSLQALSRAVICDR